MFYCSRIFCIGFKLSITFYALLLIFSISVQAQTKDAKVITLNGALNIALQNSPIAKNAELKLEATELHKKAIFDLAGTSVNFHYGQINSDLNDKFLEINQSFGSIPVHIQKNRVVNSEIKISKSEQQLVIRDIIAKVKIAWFQWVFALQKVHSIEIEATLFKDYMKSVNMDTIIIDDSISLEKLDLQTKYAESQNRLFQASEDYKIATNQILQLLFTDENLVPSDTMMELYAIEVKTAGPDKFFPIRYINYYTELSNLKKAEIGLERAKLFPEFYVGYFNQELMHINGFQGISAGLTIPLWYFPQKSRIKEAQISHKISLNELEYQKFIIQKKIENLRIKLDQLYVQISYYRENALVRADAIEKVALSQYEKQLINYPELIQRVNPVFTTRLEYLEKVMLYNTTAVELEYYVN
jgi:heavy metal efflux system protein